MVHSELAVQQISASSSVTNESVTQFRTFRAFVTSVSDVCSGIQSEKNGGRLGLVAFLERLQETTWSRMKAILSKCVPLFSAETPTENVLNSALLSAAEKLKWPMTVRYTSVPPEDRAAFETSFCNLLELQNMCVAKLCISTSAYLSLQWTEFPE